MLRKYIATIDYLEIGNPLVEKVNHLTMHKTYGGEGREVGEVQPLGNLWLQARYTVYATDNK